MKKAQLNNRLGRFLRYFAVCLIAAFVSYTTVFAYHEYVRDMLPWDLVYIIETAFEKNGICITVIVGIMVYITIKDDNSAA